MAVAPLRGRIKQGGHKPKVKKATRGNSVQSSTSGSGLVGSRPQNSGAQVTDAGGGEREPSPQPAEADLDNEQPEPDSQQPRLEDVQSNAQSQPDQNVDHVEAEGGDEGANHVRDGVEENVDDAANNDANGRKGSTKQKRLHWRKANSRPPRPRPKENDDDSESGGEQPRKPKSKPKTKTVSKKRKKLSDDEPDNDDHEDEYDDGEGGRSPPKVPKRSDGKRPYGGKNLLDYYFPRNFPPKC